MMDAWCKFSDLQHRGSILDLKFKQEKGDEPKKCCRDRFAKLMESFKVPLPDASKLFIVAKNIVPKKQSNLFYIRTYERIWKDIKKAYRTETGAFF